MKIDLQGEDLDIYVDKRAMIEKAVVDSYGMAGVTKSGSCRTEGAVLRLVHRIPDCVHT